MFWYLNWKTRKKILVRYKNKMHNFSSTKVTLDKSVMRQMHKNIKILFLHHDTLQIQSENHPKFVQLKTEIIVSLKPKIIDSGFLIRCEAPDGRKMDEGRGRREVKESGTVLFYGSLKNNYSHTHELIHTHTHTHTRLTLCFHSPALTSPAEADHNYITDPSSDHKVSYP